MIQVLHVINGLQTGGAEAMLTKLIQAADSANFRHHVVSLRDRGSFADSIEAAGGAVTTLNLTSIAGLPVVIQKLRKFIATADPQFDIVQGWMYQGNLAASWATPKKQTPRAPVAAPALAWNIRHSVDSLSDEKWLTRSTIRLSARCSDRPAAIIYNAQTSVEQHQRLGYPRDSVNVIPNGFDTDRFQADPGQRAVRRAQLGVAEDDRLVGVIARDHPMKGHEFLLQALAQQTAARVKAVFVGRGIDTNPRLHAAISEFNLGERVQLLGQTDDVPALCSALDIICVPSQSGEGFSNVLGEAMSCGLCPVATDIGDAATIIGETGWVVPPRDPAALARALDEAVEALATRRDEIRRACRQRVVEKFSLESIVSRYEKLYASLKPRSLPST